MLEIIDLSKSVYYYHKKEKEIIQEMNKSQGHPKSEYSITETGEKICNEEIKEYITKALDGEHFDYGYIRMTYHLREEYKLKINKKKVYRLCKELNVLKGKIEMNKRPKVPIAINRKVTKSNQLWELDIKYGYIQGEDKFFYICEVIDVFDRSIIEYHIGLTCKACEVVKLLKCAYQKRNASEGGIKPVIRTDNGPQFISNEFEFSCQELGLTHERIPCATPNKNAHIESFHSLLERYCLRRYIFKTYLEAYSTVGEYMDYYNKRRIHGSLKKAPEVFYRTNIGKTVDRMVINL